MAWLEKRPTGRYQISFRFGGKRYKRTLKTTSARAAESSKIRLEDTIRLVESGRLVIPDDADIALFLLSEGKLSRSHVIKDSPLEELCESYLQNAAVGKLEPSTVKTLQIHFRHLNRVLGKRRSVAQLQVADLQTYINRRSRQEGRRGRTVSGTTIRKEIASFRALWNWATETGLLEEKDLRLQRLRYPRINEVPPFRTFSEVEALTRGLDSDSDQAKELWSTVFLDRSEVDELLNLVQGQPGSRAFVYPMFVMAAHTGMRRSELLRAQLEDVSVDGITVRERKRSKSVNTTRRVHFSKRLANAVTAWLAVRPDSPTLFCHVGGDGSLSAPGDPITLDEANHIFKQALAATRFRHLRGWHSLRHSFCSNCAARGIDQRMIDAWVGHTTDEMRRRYRHLFPSAQQAALQEVFG